MRIKCLGGNVLLFFKNVWIKVIFFSVVFFIGNCLDIRN